MESIEDQSYIDVQHIIFSNKISSFVEYYNKKSGENLRTGDVVKNKHTIRVGNTVIIFIDSERDNAVICAIIEKVFKLFDSIRGKDIIITGDEAGLRVEILKRCVERVLQDNDDNATVRTQKTSNLLSDLYQL
mmetsp:Transcript_16720/g.15079  ORF Transcript_16720/g.15079 Transcript_16720/m.15079 type:complete len:133 (+) Transcript_16720:338-736(+)